MAYPTPQQAANINTTTHFWGLGDRYYKLAQRYYDDPTLWWVIAWFNQLPTEHHVDLGDVVLIPLNLDEILSIFDV